MKLSRLFTQFVSFLLCVTFTRNSVVTPAVAQSLPTILNLPVPGAQVNLSPSFKPVLLKGMTINPENPLAFDFIVNAGDSNLKNEDLKNESMKLVKYFMAALTVPENDLWVNLSPTEKNRIIPENFGYTDMGRDLLAQDYLLKQITATLLSPDGELGKIFWDELNSRERSRPFPTEELSEQSRTDFLSKIWIVPDQALVYEHGNSAFVAHCHLRVMIKEDVQDLVNIRRGASPWAPVNGQTQGSVPTNMIKETIIPTIEREVNEGKNFAQLRQVFYSLILATWYKQALQNSLFNQLYANQNKVTGIEDKFILGKVDCVIL